MSDREKKIKRIAAVRKELHRLAEWKLRYGMRTDAVLKNRQDDLLHFLDNDTAYTGRFALTAMLRLRHVAEMRRRLASERETLIKQVLEEGRLLRLSERMLRDVEQERRDEMQYRDLEEVIEASLTPRK